MEHKTTASQNERFLDALFDGIWAPGLVEAIKGLFTGDMRWVLEWVADNFAPEEVFNQGDLERWAESQGWKLT